MSADTIALWTMVAGWAAVITAAIGLRFLGVQVAQGTESLRKNGFLVVLELEQSISSARAHFAEIEYQVGLSAVKLSSPPTQQERDFFELEQKRRAEALEHYLNSVDRLAACIIRGLVDEDEYRQDYRNTFNELVTQHNKEFGPGTRHRNILDVQIAWSKDESAKRRRKWT